MKTGSTILMAMLFLALIGLNGCKKDGDNDSDSLKGLVQATDWGYSSNTLFFKLSIQYAAVGSPTDLEYAIYDGSYMIQKGSATTVNQDAGLGIFFDTPEITISCHKAPIQAKPSSSGPILTTKRPWIPIPMRRMLTFIRSRK